MVKRWYEWLAPNSGPGALTLLPWLRRHKALLSSEDWKKLTYLHRCLWTFSAVPLRAFWQTVSQYGKATAQSLKRRLSSEWRKLLNISSLSSSHQLQKSTIDVACGSEASSNGSYPSHGLFTPLPSGKHYRGLYFCISQLRNCFLPSDVTFLYSETLFHIYNVLFAQLNCYCCP